MTINAERVVASHGSDRERRGGVSAFESGFPATPTDEGISAAGRRGAEAFQRWATVIPPGATLAGRYRIDWFIARGGMGEVYAAFDRELGDRIALKTMTSALAGDPEALSALKAEVSLSRKVSHTNVCRIHDLGVHSVAGYPNLMFLTMEFVEGESLAARLQREGALSEPEAVQFAGGILAGLAAAHEAGVLHRDLKSDNIMLRKRPGGGFTPVIMDFGLASALNPNSSRISGDQALVGSLGYMAPEQVQGDVLRAVTDVYSLGVILFEMLTGRLPFRASTPALAALKRLQEPAPSIRSIDPNLSSDVERIVALALQPRPRDRYRSALAMLHDLEALSCYRRSTPPMTAQPGGAFKASSESAAAFDSALRAPAGGHTPVPNATTERSELPRPVAPSDQTMRGELEVTLLSGPSGRNFRQALTPNGGEFNRTEATGNTSLPPYVALASARRRAPAQRWTVAMVTGGAALGGVLWLTATSEQKQLEDSTSAGRVSIGGEAYREVTPVTVEPPLTVVQPVVTPAPGVATRGSDSKVAEPGLQTAATEPSRNAIVDQVRVRGAVVGAGTGGALGGTSNRLATKGAVGAKGPIRPAEASPSPHGSLTPSSLRRQAELPGRTTESSGNPAVEAMVPTPIDRPKKPMIAYPPELRPASASGGRNPSGSAVPGSSQSATMAPAAPR